MSEMKLPQREIIDTAKYLVDKYILRIPVNRLTNDDYWFDATNQDALLNPGTYFACPTDDVCKILPYKMFYDMWDIDNAGINENWIATLFANFLRTRATITSNFGGQFLRMFYGMKTRDLWNLTGVFRTRPGDDQIRMFQLVAVAFTYTLICGFLLAMLKSKFLYWFIQIEKSISDEGVDIWNMIEYDAMNPETWFAGLIQHFSDAIPAADLSNIKELLSRINSYKLDLPIESFAIADKLVGFFSMPNPFGHNDEEVYQKYLVLMHDDDNDMTPKFANTEDTNLRSLLQSMDRFFEQLPRIGALLSYNRDEQDGKFFATFLSKYKTQTLTSDWLINASEDVLPWFLYYRSTYLSVVNYYFLYYNYPTSPATYFERPSNDPANDADKYLIFRSIPDMPLERQFSAMTIGWWLTVLFGPMNTADDLTLENTLALHQKRVYYKNDRTVYHEVSLGSKHGEELTATGLYGIYNRINGVEPAHIFRLKFDVLDTIHADSLLTDTPAMVTSSQYVYTQGSVNVKLSDTLDRTFPRIAIPLTEITKWWATQHALYLINPTIAEPKAEAPVRTSSLTMATYQQSEDPVELNKLITDLRNMADAEKKAGNEEQFRNNLKSIKDVENALKSLKSAPNPDDEKEDE